MRKFKIEIIVENDCKTKEEGIREATKTIEVLGLKVHSCLPIKSVRTLKQNDALHLMFKQLADEMREKGIDMRTFIRVPVSFTPYSIKENLWKPLQRVMVGKESTTELDRSEDINLVYDEFNKILIERTNGEISLPPFPSIDNLIDEK